MSWRKIGRIFYACQQFDWIYSHATVPTALHIQGDIYRIYFSTRDALQRNQVGFIEIDLLEPSKILRISDSPVIQLGDPGHFDCDGIYGTSLVRDNKNLLFYYAGWNAGQRGQFFSSIGLAKSQDNGLTFDKLYNYPILSRDQIDPWACMAPTVMRVKSDNWVMWYASGIKLYYDQANNIKSYYDIKLATSKNGLTWQKTGTSAIQLGSNTSNIARACVIKTSGQFHVFYPYINKNIGTYRIGYGNSDHWLEFNRKDQHELANLPTSDDAEDWDANAVTYPYVFNHNDKMYMLYNGNGFGQTGFGLAVWEGEAL